MNCKHRISLGKAQRKPTKNQNKIGLGISFTRHAHLHCLVLSFAAALLSCRSGDSVALPSLTAVSPNCLVSLAAFEEISRFLTRVSTHATRSDICIDGGGKRERIDEVNVCPAGTVGHSKTFDVSFRVSSFTEGHSGLLRVDPQTPPPIISVQNATFVFNPKGSGFVLDTTVKIRGLLGDETPATSVHDGSCYGPSKAFVPLLVELP